MPLPGASRTPKYTLRSFIARKIARMTPSPRRKLKQQKRSKVNASETAVRNRMRRANPGLNL